ncbi:hypothetical protein GLOIN_2v1473325 [Rhizophagus clarus]|uniref:Uncharacterized protein n=1 Tax=Rhizophagus clarus TaxID=94130 RepID=A0A8H3QRL3_9GLOM|nr:hypothetical protein GLOIN_2v1473325 [Rhizophagus clarus]
MFDKVIFELLEQKNKKLVNRIALEKWISDGCPFEEDEDVLDLIKSKAEREAHENGVGVIHSGSIGTGENNSVICRGQDDGSKIYTSNRTTLMLKEASLLVTSTNGTQTSEFCEHNKHRRKGFKSGNVSDLGKVSKRNDKRFGTTK